MAIRSKIPFVGSEDYPVQIISLQKRSGGKTIRKNLKGRRIREEDKGYVYQLSNGEETQPIPYEAVDMNEDGNPVVNLYSPEPGRYVPLTFDPVEEELEPVIMREGAEAYRKNRYNKSRQFYQRKGLLEQYQAPITIVIFALAFILMSAGMVNFMDGLAGQFADQLTEAVGTAAGQAAGAG